MNAPAAQRQTVVWSLDDALAEVRDGAVVGIGGAVTAGHPMALVRGLVRRGVRNLTVVAPTAGLEVDLLVAAGCVRKVATSYVGAEAVAPLGPAFRAAAEAGSIEIWDGDEAHFAMGLRAAGAGLPFMPWRGGVGTALPEINRELVEFDDPVRGERLLAIPALELDIALLHAEVVDAYGNVQFGGTGYMDPLLGAAAQKVIVQADRVAPNDEIRRRPEKTHFWRDTLVVRAPWGTHPYSSGWLEADADHLGDYTRAAQAAAKGERAALDAYLQTYVYGAATHEDYLEAVGVRRLSELLI